MKWRAHILFGFSLCFIFYTEFSFAQSVYEHNGYEFTVLVKHEATSIKDQAQSSTCWSFSVLSMLETELLKKGKGEYDFSEMFIVYHTYLEKAVKYLRVHGNLGFSGGGALNDVTDMMQKYGIMTEEAFPGRPDKVLPHNHEVMDIELKKYMDELLNDKERIKEYKWINGFKEILEKYMGTLPLTFKKESREYTPDAFLSELGIHPEDYVLLTSYNHHPFYLPFVLEVPDNWSYGKPYNVKIEDMISIFDSALYNGYTIAWATDVSEAGFSWGNGLAIVPTSEEWENRSSEEKFKEPVKELTITQEMRQEAFDTYTTTDDHGMHAIGIAKDQNGKEYYVVKNSWGTYGNCYQGYIFVSKAFVRYKTMSFLVHKNGIPTEIRKKLGI